MTSSLSSKILIITVFLLFSIQLLGNSINKEWYTTNFNTQKCVNPGLSPKEAGTMGAEVKEIADDAYMITIKNTNIIFSSLSKERCEYMLTYMKQYK